jgi:hypothetical protein
MSEQYSNKNKRAIVWDKTAHLGTQSRRGPIRIPSEYQLRQCERDKTYLESNCDEVVTGQSKVIIEGDTHWDGLTDTVFQTNPNP